MVRLPSPEYLVQRAIDDVHEAIVKLRRYPMVSPLHGVDDLLVADGQITALASTLDGTKTNFAIADNASRHDGNSNRNEGQSGSPETFPGFSQPF